ncbi:hypothetical protein Y032_0145g2491 [Ancylostoma ceylanicum]|uniref:Uncharacterized protein n=1 Tax=Ancylostoma ceylanicum TaxID=53326 RepID=A0A016T2T9_9BILA|nr:hypothetical protein Y032_0145g2491 [Ancylostoma ceylanicum]
MYLIISTLLLKIPIFVVIYYTTFTIASYSGGHILFCSSYQCSLYDLSLGYLWFGLIISFICCIVDGILTAALRKLRLLSKGVSAVMVARENCHIPRPVVVAAPQRVIYTTTTANVGYPPANVYVTPTYPPPAQPYVHQPSSIQQPQLPPNPSASQPPPEYKP